MRVISLRLFLKISKMKEKLDRIEKTVTLIDFGLESLRTDVLELSAQLIRNSQLDDFTDNKRFFFSNLGSIIYLGLGTIFGIFITNRNYIISLLIGIIILLILIPQTKEYRKKQFINKNAVEKSFSDTQKMRKLQKNFKKSIEKIKKISPSTLYHSK